MGFMLEVCVNEEREQVKGEDSFSSLSRGVVERLRNRSSSNPSHRKMGVCLGLVWRRLGSLEAVVVTATAATV